jgi:hypothetical protein
MGNIILFGAGASFGSKNHNVPPLGDDLFYALQSFNSTGWGGLPASVAEVFHGDFEKGMASLSKTKPHAMPVLQRAMAAFFFTYIPTENNLYHLLAKRIKACDWQGSIVSLNYERLLELSLSHGGIQPVIGQAALAKNQVELCLPHGCCHLFCEGVNASSSGVSFSPVKTFFDGKVRVISNPNEYNQKINGNAVPPVMSYFEPQKNTSAGVSFIRNQRARWSQLVVTSDTIAIIGIKVREQDVHIWEELKTAPGKILYCGGQESGKEFKHWHAKYRGDKESIITQGYFEEEFDVICKALNISA